MDLGPAPWIGWTDEFPDRNSETEMALSLHEFMVSINQTYSISNHENYRARWVLCIVHILL